MPRNVNAPPRFDGKEKRLSFGTFPDVSIRKARDAQAEKHHRAHGAANSFEHTRGRGS